MFGMVVVILNELMFPSYTYESSRARPALTKIGDYFSRSGTPCENQVFFHANAPADLHLPHGTRCVSMRTMSHGETFSVVKGGIPSTEQKQELYQQALDALHGLLAGETDATLIMASIVAVLHQSMPHYFWTGFYRVCGDELLVGPYQGTPACLRIAKGRGVCGTAWAQDETMVVADVHAFPGHIACDARSASEIVVPWHDAAGSVVAVLDVDSSLLAAFDETDRTLLEEMARRFPFG